MKELPQGLSRDSQFPWKASELTWNLFLPPRGKRKAGEEGREKPPKNSNNLENFQSRKKSYLSNAGLFTQEQTAALGSRAAWAELKSKRQTDARGGPCDGEEELSGVGAVLGSLPDRSHHREHSGLPSSGINLSWTELGTELQNPSFAPATSPSPLSDLSESHPLCGDRHRGLRRAETERWSTSVVMAGESITRSPPHYEPVQSQTPRGNFRRSHMLPAPCAVNRDMLIRNPATSSAEKKNNFSEWRARARQLQQRMALGAESLSPAGRMLSPNSCLGFGSPRDHSCLSCQGGRSRLSWGSRDWHSRTGLMPTAGPSRAGGFAQGLLGDLLAPC